QRTSGGEVHAATEENKRADEPAPAEETPTTPPDTEPVAEGPPAGDAEPSAEPPREPEPHEKEIADLLESGRSEDEILDILSERKEILNEKANRHRALRDKLNDETKRHVQERDRLNAQVRGLIDQANEHKRTRDRENASVREAKVKRDELNTKANEKLEALNSLKKDRLPKEGPSVARLKRQLKQLEFQQMTKVLTPKKEKELIDLLSALQKEIQEKEKAFDKDQEVKTAYLAMKEAKEAAEAQHRHVTELADKAQSAHDSMVKLFEEADKIRREADKAQELFVGAKIQADKVHHEYIAMVNTVRDYEKVVMGLRQKVRKERKDRGEAEAKQEAEDIFAKFKRGEKLSTEDLMALQKAGLL
ncbi:MAG: coiled-coil protein, partial [Methanobacteriota archaeon]